MACDSKIKKKLSKVYLYILGVFGLTEIFIIKLTASFLIVGQVKFSAKPQLIKKLMKLCKNLICTVFWLHNKTPLMCLISVGRVYFPVCLIDKKQESLFQCQIEWQDGNQAFSIYFKMACSFSFCLICSVQIKQMTVML